MPDKIQIEVPVKFAQFVADCIRVGVEGPFNIPEEDYKELLALADDIQQAAPFNSEQVPWMYRVDQ